MNPVLSSIKQVIRRIVSPGSVAYPSLATIKELAHGIFTTHPDEIACQKCFERLARFAEMSRTGEGVAEAMPLVQEHLDRCPDCREEYEALLAAMHATT